MLAQEALAHQRQLAKTRGLRLADLNNLSSLLAQTRACALPEDFGLPARAKDHPAVFIACLPKTGSTLLSNAVADATGLIHAYAFYEAHQGEQDIDREALVYALHRPSVIQQHVRATEANMQLLQAMALKPIFLYRNLLDALASMRDMLQTANESVFFPWGYSDLPIETRTELVALRFGFWYIECFASWVKAAQTNRLDVLFMSYEEVSQALAESIYKVLMHSGIEPNSVRITSAVQAIQSQPERTRRGKSHGRRETFSSELVAYLKGHTACFPKVDFSPLGL